MNLARPSGSDRLCLGVLAAVVILGGLGAALWPALRPSGPETGTEIATSGATPPADPAVPEAVAPPPSAAAAADASAFDLEAVASGVPVPRAAATALAGEGSPVVRGDTDARLRRLLAQALLADEAVSKDRERLWSLRHALAAGMRLPAEDRLWVGVLRDRYQAGDADFEELSLRVDTVPPSLLIAASMSAVSAKAPAARPGDEARKQPVRAPAVRDDVRTPLHVLNAHRAYAAFRRERAEMRRAGTRLDALRLAEALPAEGAGGVAGGKEIAATVASAGLLRFDSARLEPPGTAALR